MKRRFLFSLGGALACLLAVGHAEAQSLRILSEFQRVDPFGNIIAADRAPKPREILSPAVARNAYASYHVAVTVPQGKTYSLFVEQNPEGAVGITVYRELFVRRGGGWVPDGLEKVAVPFTSSMPAPGGQIPRQTTAVYWVDLRVPEKARVGRIRVEAQLSVDNEWVIAPLEVRILPPVVPKVAPVSGPLGAVEEPADSSARDALRDYLCAGGRAGDKPVPLKLLTIRRMIRRNAAQDMAMARALEASAGRDAVVRDLTALAGGSDAAAWCESPSFPRGRGAEWYLSVRDALLRKMVD